MKYTVRSCLIGDVYGAKVANPDEALQKVIEEYRKSKKMSEGLSFGASQTSRKVIDIFYKKDSVYVVAETLPTKLGEEWATAIREDIMSRPPSTPTGIWVYCGYAFISYWTTGSEGEYNGQCLA